VAAATPAPQDAASAPGFTVPVAIVQPIPPFTPGTDLGYVTRGTGEIELTINADGSVAAARMTVPIMPRYDALLVNTAIAQWKYKPATRVGVAVPYTMRVRIVVQRR